MDILGIITARGGSKTIPKKNIANLAGRPLLAYTCDAALQSSMLTRVILSTEDEGIAHIGRESDIEVPFLRPKELAMDDTPTLPVITHALNWLLENDAYSPEIVVVLQPTSPLRRAAHIDEAVNLLKDRDADSVVSVVEVPHQYNPVSILEIENGLLRPFLEGQENTILRRQDKPRVYARNGPAVLATYRRVLEDMGTLYGRNTIPYIMGWPESLDIDTPEDLFIAECFLKGTKCVS